MERGKKKLKDIKRVKITIDGKTQSLYEMICNCNHISTDKKKYKQFIIPNCDGPNIKIENVDMSEIDLPARNSRCYPQNINLSHSVIHYVLFRDCDMSNIALCGSYITHCTFNNCNLQGANFTNTMMNDCTFQDCDLSNSSFSCSMSDETVFNRCTFKESDFSYCTISDGKFYNCDLKEADTYGLLLPNLQGFFKTEMDPLSIPMACPTDGKFIGWKKLIGCPSNSLNPDDKREYLAKLEIPANAKRSSAFSRKCRCSKAKVLGIYNLDGEKTDIKEFTHITRSLNISTTYTVGKYVYPDTYDDDRFEECSNGIHFFINKQDAIDY